MLYWINSLKKEFIVKFGVFKMKKIISIGILFVVLIAFGGSASASYVTDHRSHSFLNTGFDKYIESSSVIHYSDNHILFRYRVAIYSNGYRDLYVFYRDYQKISYHKIIEKTYEIDDGYYFLNNKRVITTLHSPYYQFRLERGRSKSVNSPLWQIRPRCGTITR
jgi:hypothetical protein